MQEAVVQIDCDGCGEEIQISVPAYSEEETADEADAVEEKLTANGWLVAEDEVYCPACAPMYADKEGN
jgi:hypothetical protein